MTTALYLAHLNPVTNAHVEIIKELKKEADIVKVMPVIFKYENREVNSKSFPFNFETRKKINEKKEELKMLSNKFRAVSYTHLTLPTNREV